MDVLITAGGTPLPGELLYEYTRGAPKAMLNISGKPMVQWVLDAVSHSSKVDHIIIIGLQELGGITCPKPLTLLPSQSDMLANIITGISQVKRLNPQAEQVLVVASDIPAITTEMVDWMIDIVEKSDADIFYNVVTKEVMEKKYPSSKRTYTHLKDVDICGGDMNAVRIDMLDKESRLWEELITSRKNPLKQAYIIGFDLLLKSFSAQQPSKKLQRPSAKDWVLKGKVINCPFPEVGMDVDKPRQLEIVRQDLSRSGIS